MKIRILTAADVRAALPMKTAIDAMKSAFGQLSAGRAEAPLRGRLHSDKGVTLLMPAFLRDSREMAIKIVSVYMDNPGMGLPTVNGVLLALDPETGMPRAFMEADALTAIRTGAGGGLAADLLARKDAETAALFGAGVQARAQILAVLAVRSIKRVAIFDPSRSMAGALADEMAEWPDAPGIQLADSPEGAVRDADIVITATTSKTPVFNGADLRPGSHVTGIGSFSPDARELDDVAVQRARVVVDSRESCLAEAGDIIIPGAAIDAEIGEIINGREPGRQSDDQITLFKSVGQAVQDAAAAAAVLAEAENKNLGKVIDMEGGM